MLNKFQVYIFSFLAIFAGGCVSIENKPFPGTPPPQAVPQGVYHKVQPKETLWNIAKAYNVNIEDIIRANNIPNAAQIEKNQLIFIPGATEVKETSPVSSGASSGAAESEFIWPVKGRIINYFGEQRDFSLNNGIDIQSSAGEIVSASRSGRVVFADYIPGYGFTVILVHNDGYYTVYSQNSSLLVKLGDDLAQGKPVSRCGPQGDVAFLLFVVTAALTFSEIDSR